MAVAIPRREEGTIVLSPVTAAEAAALAVVTIGAVLRSYRAAPAPRPRTPGHRVRRRAARFTTRSRRPARRLTEGSGPNASAV